MPDFTKFRITTDGEKFRVEGYYKPLLIDEQWVPLSKDWYCGCKDFGYYALDPLPTFDSKKDAIDYIKKMYGENGLNKIEKTWILC